LRHFASSRFWTLLEALPSEIGAVAKKNYELLKSNPRHPSLQFKRLGSFWSVRVGLHYRALGRDIGDDVLWFWIGTHDDYDKLVG
jgi:hypothetical protein